MKAFPPLIAKELSAVDRKGAGGQAVETVIAVDDVLPPRETACELDRPFDRLRSAVAEKDARQPAADMLG